MIGIMVSRAPGAERQGSFDMSEVRYEQDQEAEEAEDDDRRMPERVWCPPQ